MPELPDITAYIDALEARVLGQPLQRIRLSSPFLLRTARPAPAEAEGRTVRQLRRAGKRIAIGVEGGLWLVLHLMIAGRLHAAARETLELWIARLRAEGKERVPEKVTAFRDGMAMHGRFGQPCPRCGESVQRIRYADNETNYCAPCQTGGAPADRRTPLAGSPDSAPGTAIPDPGSGAGQARRGGHPIAGAACFRIWLDHCQGR